MAAMGLAIGLQTTPAQAITTWDWSFTGPGPRSGSGTFTTADVVPTANTIYDILGISGSINLLGTTYDILGLSTFGGAVNKFSWDGTSLSKINSDLNGISFETSGGFDVKIHYSQPLGFGPVTAMKYSNTTVPTFISSSSLQPQQPVPGPLPLFGAAAAYSWSRRLRRRIAEKV
jgi:hypothetical protein